MAATEAVTTYKKTAEAFTFLPLFIILFGIKTVSKTRFECRKPLIYKAFSTFVYYSHSLLKNKS